MNALEDYDLDHHEGIWSLVGINHRVQDIHRAIQHFRKSAEERRNEESQRILDILGEYNWARHDNGHGDLYSELQLQKLVEIFKADESFGCGLYIVSRIIFPREEHDGPYMMESFANRVDLIQKSIDLGYSYACATDISIHQLSNYELSANQNNPMGLYALGCHYVEKSKMSKRWSKLAELTEFEYDKLGKRDDKYLEKGTELIEKAAERGWIDAMDKCTDLFQYLKIEKSIFWGGKVISYGLRCEAFVRILDTFATAYDRGIYTELTSIFLLGRAMCKDVSKNFLWRELFSAPPRLQYGTLSGELVMELYQVWCKSAQDAAITFLCICKRQGVNKDVAKIIAQLIWESRMVPVSAGWHALFEKNDNLIKV